MKASQWIAVLAVLWTMPFVFAQQDFSNVEIRAIPVAKNIYMVQGAGGNIGVSVGPDGILIVDDQFAPLAGKILARLHPKRYGSDQENAA